MKAKWRPSRPATGRYRIRPLPRQQGAGARRAIECLRLRPAPREGFKTAAAVSKPRLPAVAGPRAPPALCPTSAPMPFLGILAGTAVCICWVSAPRQACGIAGSVAGQVQKRQPDPPARRPMAAPPTARSHARGTKRRVLGRLCMQRQCLSFDGQLQCRRALPALQRSQ